MFDIALGVFLFLSPIFVLLGNNARLNGIFGALQFHQFKSISLESSIIQLQFFEYAIAGLFIVALANNQRRNFKDLNFSLLFGACALSVIFHPKTLSSFPVIFLGFLLYYLVVKYANRVKRLFYVIAIVSILNTVFAFLQFFNNPISRIDGLMGLSSHLGTYQALAFPVCYSIHPLLSIIPLIGVFLSGSATSLIALSIGVIYMFYHKKEKIFINLAPMGLTAILGIAIVLISRNYAQVFSKFLLRLELWGEVLKQILRHPFIGYGLNSFPSLSHQIFSRLGYCEWIYNEYLNVAFCLGVFALIPVYGFLKDKFNNVGLGINRYIAASCLIASIICIAQPSLNFARLAGTIIPLFAFLEILKRKENLKC